MATDEELIQLFKTVQEHENRIVALENNKKVTSTKPKIATYKSGSTNEKIMLLLREGFFNAPHSISEMITELKIKDYHLKASDLTLPLRKIVRDGHLRRTRRNSNNSESKNWLYVAV